MKILISGSTGLIGRFVTSCFENQGHKVVSLSRNLETSGVMWRPEKGVFEKKDFEGFDAIIHLAGKNIGSGRWKSSLKEEIFKSRCRDTRILSEIICCLENPPKTFIVASGIGYYGNRGKSILTENDVSGTGFLSKVCKNWERATSPIKGNKTRVIHLRLGVVLSKKGGLLPYLEKQFRLGLGAVISNGNQYLSWVSIEDVFRSILFLLKNSNLKGPVNLVSPFPETNYHFSMKLAKALKRPCWIKIPKWFLYILIGKEKVDEMLLSSARAIPEKLISSGFTFRYEKIEQLFSSLYS